MFNQSLIQGSSVLLSTLVQQLGQQEHSQVKNQKIDFDLGVVNLNQAISFENCILSFPSVNQQHSTTVIYTSEGFRIENSKIELSICIIGQNRQNNTQSYLGKDGPNVFFDECEFFPHSMVFPNGPTVTTIPQIQVTGVVDHCRIKNPSGKVKASIAQCSFYHLQLEGSFDQLQLTEYLGKELNFTNLNTRFLWFQRPLKDRVARTTIDQGTVKNLITETKKEKRFNKTLTESLQVVSEALKINRQGVQFLKLNKAICSQLKRQPENMLRSWIVYGWFKNFYSTWSMALTSLITIFLFAMIYFLAPTGSIILSSSTISEKGFSLFDAIYFSAITFATVGYGDFTPQGILRGFAAVEGICGVFLVIVTGFVFSRQYSDY